MKAEDYYLGKLAQDLDLDYPSTETKISTNDEKLISSQFFKKDFFPKNIDIYSETEPQFEIKETEKKESKSKKVNLKISLKIKISKSQKTKKQKRSRKEIAKHENKINAHKQSKQNSVHKQHKQNKKRKQNKHSKFHQSAKRPFAAFSAEG